MRAFAVSDGRTPFAIADIEAQGWFVAIKNGPYGLLDMRKAVEQRTGGALPAEDVVIQSDHSHSGPDALGVWGGVPDEYRSYVSDRTVEAIVDAYTADGAGQLYYGTAPGRDLLSNQFDYDAANKAVDSDVRVLQARDGDRNRLHAAQLLRARDRARLGQHEGVRRLGPGREPAAGAALRRQGRDGGRDARAHAARRPRLRRPERRHRGRAEPLQDQRLRGARGRSRRAGGGERAAARRRAGRVRALLPGPGRRDERADPRPASTRAARSALR